MWNWIGKLEELQKRGEVFVVATMVSVSGSVPREVGAKMIVLADGTIFGTIGGGGIEKLVINDAKNIVLDGESRVKKYSLKAEAGMSCGGAAEVLYEVINKGPKLYVFGAGHVAQALCRTLIGSPFRVELIDWREEWVMSTKIPDGVIRHKKSWQDFCFPWKSADGQQQCLRFYHVFTKRELSKLHQQVGFKIIKIFPYLEADKKSYKRGINLVSIVQK